MSFAIPLWDVPLLAVVGDPRLFPVRRIYCVGQNYAAHAREMGADPTRTPPFFFAKPADALVTGEEVPYPPATESFHHEVELVVAVGRGGRDLRAEDALAHVLGYAVGLDLTRRDLQAAARAQGHPWDMAKGFDASAPCSPLRRAAEIGHPRAGRIELSVDGTLRQEGDLADMIWSVPEVLAHLSRLVTLAPGDLIFTGTPPGVGPLERGARVAARIEGVGELRLAVT